MSKYNVGDIVTTTETQSYWRTPIPTGPKRVCVLFELRGEVGIEDIPKTPNRNYVLKVGQVQPYAPTFKPGDVVEVLLDCDDPVFSDRLVAGTQGTFLNAGYDGFARVSTEAHRGAYDGYFAAKPQNLRLVTTYDLKKVAEILKPGIKAGTGWTFRIPADAPIDGKRVLKELADAGADYAVVSWGKRDDQRLCLVSLRLAERAVAAGVDENLTREVVTNFHQAFTSTANASSLAGTSNYCYVNATTLAELEDYAKRVKDAERAKRPTTVRVNFGVAK